MVPYNSIKKESSNFFARDLLLASTDSNASTKHSYEYETMEECPYKLRRDARIYKW